MFTPEGSQSTPDGPRGGFLGFVTSLPGVLTALAAVLTAVGGILIAVKQGDSKAASGPTTPPPTVTSTSAQDQGASNLASSGGPAPVNVTVTLQDLRLGNASDDADNVPSQGSDGSAEQLIAACGQGDEGACMTVVKALVDECARGYGVSCDVLYEISPAGSDLETYGATCGLRLDANGYADRCREQ
jgi:hypothetical protein